MDDSENKNIENPGTFTLCNMPTSYRRKTSTHLVPAVLSIIILLTAIFFDPDDGIYDLLRLIVSGTSVLFAFTAKPSKFNIEFYMCILTAIVFNPLIKVSFDRETWQAIDLIAAAIFVYFIVKLIKSDSENVSTGRTVKEAEHAELEAVRLQLRLGSEVKCPVHKVKMIKKPVMYGSLNPKIIESGKYKDTLLGGCVMGRLGNYGFQCPVDSKVYYPEQK
jgi:hypothetical protein